MNTDDHHRVEEDIHHDVLPQYEQHLETDIDQRARLCFVSVLGQYERIIFDSDESDMSERNEASIQERCEIYSLISNCCRKKIKNISWDRYIIPVHVLNKVNHGIFQDSTYSDDFMHAVLQLFISIEKCIEFPLTLPNHIFRYVFDNYGDSSFSSLDVFRRKFSEVSGDRILCNGNDAIFFFKYFMSHTSIPDCMELTMNNDSSGGSKYYVDLSVSSFKVKEFPISLSDMMRVCQNSKVLSKKKRKFTENSLNHVRMLPKILIICVNDKEKSPNQFPIDPETTLNLSENTVDGIELVKEYELLACVSCFEGNEHGCLLSSYYSCVSRRTVHGVNEWFDYTSKGYRKLDSEGCLYNSLRNGVLFFYCIV